MADEGRAALGAGKASARKFVDLFLEYLVPLATFFVGLFTGIGTWGGVNSLWSAMSDASQSLAQSGAWPASAALFGGIFGITGAAFWHMSKGGGTVYMAVGRGFGGYFFGTAVSYLLAWFANKPVGDGLIDELVAGIRGL